MSATDPLAVIAQAVTHKRSVIVETHHGGFFVGEPICIGPRSVWFVMDGVDIFIRFENIATVETVAVNPEGA